MAKSGEIEYLDRIGEAGQNHARNKPFSDEYCGAYLADIGYILSLLPTPPAMLLDLGVGTGWTSIFFAKRGFDVTAQDIAPAMIDIAEQNKKEAGVENLTFITSDYENLTENAKFDCAVFFDSLHHAEDPGMALSSVYKALKPGGICLTAEPGIRHSKSDAAVRAKSQYNVTENDMHPAKIIKIAKKVGFEKHSLFLRQRIPVELGSLRSTLNFLIKGLPFFRYYLGNIVLLKKT